MPRLYKSRASSGRRRATIKRADAELYKARVCRGRRRAKITRADAEAIQI